jgi:hypothetical protein
MVKTKRNTKPAKTKRKGKSPGSWDDKFVSKLLKEPPVLTDKQVSGIEHKIQRDAYRRTALVFLAKPFKEMAEKFAKDRKGAVAFADVAYGARAMAQRYKSLSDLLESASMRIEVALCSREDFREVLEEGKPDWWREWREKNPEVAHGLAERAEVAHG